MLDELGYISLNEIEEALEHIHWRNTMFADILGDANQPSEEDIKKEIHRLRLDRYRKLDFPG